MLASAETEPKTVDTAARGCYNHCMYKPRFPYAPLSRQSVDGRRLYATPDGRNLPSVTTILEATKPQEKREALQAWRQRVGVERAQQITTEASNRGTKMHTFLENYVRAGALSERPQNPFHRASWHMAGLVVDQGLRHCDEFWGLEVPLYFPGIYAGTTDCVGLHRGRPTIIDFKQTNKPKRREWIEDYFLQLCAYAEAHNELHGTEIDQGVIMMCVKPEMDGNLEVSVPPQYQEFLLEGTDYEHYRQTWWSRVEQYYSKHC